ncbi:MAG TPA: glycosyl hydrolase [Armatimonadota bacterium]|nr:glycosyl hydrolase [Armatimonadota bacterium]
MSPFGIPRAAGRAIFLQAFVCLFCLAPSQGAAAASAAGYRKLADNAVSSKQFGKAAVYYREEANLYRQKGDAAAAVVEEGKAARWSTDIQLFADAPPNPKAAAALDTHAKFEPAYGCYLGAYVANDDSLDGGPDSMGNVIYAKRAEILGRLIHKPLATSWDYCNYGNPFPRTWAQALLSDGIAPRIALEPNDGLSEIKDDSYLEQFARDAASCGGPIFLRFAGEMNGDWTAWHNDPSLYKAKFRLVHDVMARLAPNVAMIWCVNQVPEYNMDDYYPGDAYVDWVGVNFYSVLHHDNDPARPAGFENPASLLEYVYHKYAARKPIAICEYGASHRDKLDLSKDESVVAANKLAELFSALPREFPRVKMVGLYDCDNLTARHIQPGRALNDYSVTDSPVVLSALTRAVAPDYYLTHVVTGTEKHYPTYVEPVTAGMTFSGPVSLTAWVKSYEDSPTIIYRIDGKDAARVTGPGECRAVIDTSKYGAGRHQLSVLAMDSSGQRAGGLEVPVIFAPASKPATKPAARPASRPSRAPHGAPKPHTTPAAAAPESGLLDRIPSTYLGLAFLALALLVLVSKIWQILHPESKPRKR